jgi:glutathione S-transferase
VLTRALSLSLSLCVGRQIAPLFDGSKDYAEEKKAAIVDLETSLQIIDARLANTQFIAGACQSLCVSCVAYELLKRTHTHTHNRG